MRCKNCGADNDDNRYICEVCGSPLYDEDDFDNAASDDNDKTQTFKAVNHKTITIMIIMIINTANRKTITAATKIPKKRV
mgnify:CR=1 FL=1